PARRGGPVGEHDRRRRQPSAAVAVHPPRPPEPDRRVAGAGRAARADLAAGARGRTTTRLRLNGPPGFRPDAVSPYPSNPRAPQRACHEARPMPHKTLPTRLLTAMMATGLMLATTAALAQGTSRAEQRRAERAAKADEAQQVDKF